MDLLPSPGGGGVPGEGKGGVYPNAVYALSIMRDTKIILVLKVKGKQSAGGGQRAGPGILHQCRWDSDCKWKWK